MLALVVTLWALVDPRRRSAASLVALCFWSALAGGALQGALWASITTENSKFQQRKIAALPQGATAADVDLQPMQALRFFVSLDRFGRRLGYITVIHPLLLSIRLVSYTRERPGLAKQKLSVSEEEERFTIE